MPFPEKVKIANLESALKQQSPLLKQQAEEISKLKLEKKKLEKGTERRLSILVTFKLLFRVN